MKTKQSTAKPGTITIQLDAEMAGMLEAVMISQGKLSTPTQVLRACAEAGLIRLCVISSKASLSAIKEPAFDALAHVHPSRIATACFAIEATK